MDASEWARVNELFHRAVELSEPERTRFLDEACGTDAGLRQEVSSLLEANSRAGKEFLEKPISVGERVPTTIGPWRVVRELGRGGMGTVYLAERADGAFAMQAAIKVLRRGLDTEDLLARFRDERQILATFEHPHIARLLDGGATDDGRPWLAMEFIEGTSLLEACSSLDRDGKLKLFRKLVDAVQYAHRSLVVHRDLKPGNVLVTKQGEPKLLDFGIAKMLGREGAELTRTGEMVLTPAYASPEQVRGERVTTSVDVWALGVILYELLTGRRPFEGAGLPLANSILEGEAPPPRLGADLDAVLFTALRKEPRLRYPSVEAFADDLDRLAAGEPLRARTPTFGYWLGKFVQRHRVAVGAGVLTVLSLTGGVIATLAQAREARLARERAEASRARAEELVDFMLGDLRRKLEPSSRLDVLEDVSNAVQTYFETVPADELSPERRARTLQQLATVKVGQAKPDAVEVLVKKSLEALQAAPHTADADLLRATGSNLLGQAFEGRGELEAALAAFDSTRTQLKSVVERRPDDVNVVAMWCEANNDVGRVLFALGKSDAALEAHQAAWAIISAKELPGRVPKLERGRTKLYLGRIFEADGRRADAEAAFRENLRLARELHAAVPEAIDLEDYLSISLNELGRTVRLAGRPDEAEPLAVEALALSEAALARDPQNAIRIDGLSASRSFLGRAREEMGKLEPARQEFLADVKLSERLLEKEPENGFAQAALADGLTNVGRAERKLGNVEAARAAHLRALSIREALVVKDESFKFDVAISKLELGRVQRLAKENPRASFEAALVIFEALGGKAEDPAKQRGRYAQVLIELGRLDEARVVVGALRESGAIDAELKTLADGL